MDQYKLLIIKNIFLLSIVKGIAYSLDDPPIYNPLNLKQEIYPVDSIKYYDLEEVIEKSTEENILQDTESTSIEQTDKVKIKKELNYSTQLYDKKKVKKDYLNEKLFDEEVSLPLYNGIGGDSGGDAFYFELIDELIGTSIYGRKNDAV